MLQRGRYQARFAAGAADLRAVQTLRHKCFVEQIGGAARLDPDSYDAKCQHVLVEDQKSGAVVCGFRLLVLQGGAACDQSYSGQYYDLTALRQITGSLIELGRFCIHPDWRDPDILRVAWGVMAASVSKHHAEMLFGCASFQGTQSDPYLDAFDLLAARHLAPATLRPQIKAPHVYRFGDHKQSKPDPKQAILQLPPLLRTYLSMGAWVSDHAVVDEQMNTLHVFTGLEIAAIPPARIRALQRVAG